MALSISQSPKSIGHVAHEIVDEILDVIFY